MTTDLFLKMSASYFMIFGGVYLLVTMIEIIEDYLRRKKLLNTLDRIEEKVDLLPNGMNRVPCSLEREQGNRSVQEIEEDWWFANR